MKAMDLVVGSVRETSSIRLRGDVVVDSATQPLRGARAVVCAELRPKQAGKG